MRRHWLRSQGKRKASEPLSEIDAARWNALRSNLFGEEEQLVATKATIAVASPENKRATLATQVDADLWPLFARKRTATLDAHFSLLVPRLYAYTYGPLAQLPLLVKPEAYVVEADKKSVTLSGYTGVVMGFVCPVKRPGERRTKAEETKVTIGKTSHALTFDQVFLVSLCADAVPSDVTFTFSSETNVVAGLLVAATDVPRPPNVLHPDTRHVGQNVYVTTKPVLADDFAAVLEAQQAEADLRLTTPWGTGTLVPLRHEFPPDGPAGAHFALHYQVNWYNPADWAHRAHFIVPLGSGVSVNGTALPARCGAFIPRLAMDALTATVASTSSSQTVVFAGQ